MIRKAKSQDLDAVEKMYEEIITAPPLPDSSVGWILGVYPTRKTAEDALGREDLFVLEDEGRVVASAIINQVQVPSYREADWAYAAEDSEVMVLHTLCVFPTESKKGYGRQFVAFYEDYARKHGCSVLRMDTNQKNNRARKMYARLGYHEAGIIACNFQGIPDVGLVCLEKKL